MFVCTDCKQKCRESQTSYESGDGKTCNECVQKPKWHGFLNHTCKNGMQAITCSNSKAGLG